MIEVETIWNAKFQKVYQAVQDSSPETIEGKLGISSRSIRPEEYFTQQFSSKQGDQYLSVHTEPGRPDMNGYLSSMDHKKQPGILKKTSTKTLDQSSTRARSEERSRSPPRLEVDRFVISEWMGETHIQIRQRVER